MLSPTNKTPIPGYNPPRRRLLTPFLLLWIVLLGLAFYNRQSIFDWWELRNYQAPAAVAALADQDTMTPYGRKVFYVNHPVIDSKSDFRNACPNNGGEQTIVLGCYQGGQSGIFLLKVDDPRLDGVEQVTAAHEMLHGVYDRLSSSDREKVDGMLQDYYKNGLSDERIRGTIEAYRKSEPHDVVNEMHSVFGSEIAQLPDNLEQYYKRYFQDRSQVAAFASKYQAEFTSRKTAISQYDDKLSVLKDRIDSLQKDLDAKQGEIADTQQRLLAKKNSGDIAGYNAGVPPYNALVDSYNSEVQTVKNLVGQYNQLVEARNAVASEQDQLVKALSADATPISR